MPDLRVLIAAAGSGSRAGLPYPKTLHPVLGRPILVRLIELLRRYDAEPAVVVSPSGREPVEACLAVHGLAAELIEQDRPTGMGDAILCFRRARRQAEHLLLVWGDIPLLDPATVEAMVEAHFDHGNDFTFVTRRVERAYTVVERDAAGRVTGLVETRESGAEPSRGERDIGLFVFRTAPVLDLLEQRLPGAVGKGTGEHGFLYLVRHLAEGGFKIEALAVATERDLVSLNSLADLDALPR